MASPQTILVADDDAGVLKALSIRLEAAGYRVVTATDGYFALQRAAAHRPDLMILDVHMPAGNGLTVHERKQKLQGIADVPVVYVSGDKSEETKAATAAIGALALIQKPFEFEELLAVIKTALAAPAAEPVT